MRPGATRGASAEPKGVVMASGFSRVFMGFSDLVDRRIGWQRLPRPIGLLVLIGLRQRLRQRNLYDTETTAPKSAEQRPRPRDLNVRTIDGSFNDLDRPAMGSIGCRFGRNVPVDRTYPEKEPDLIEPNPRVVSRELLTRNKFVPATTLNVLAAAWLQFEVHDWFSHGKSEPANPFELDLDADDP